MTKLMRKKRKTTIVFIKQKEISGKRRGDNMIIHPVCFISNGKKRLVKFWEKLSNKNSLSQNIMLPKKSNNKLHIENHSGKNNIKILPKMICFTEFGFLESHNA